MKDPRARSMIALSAAEALRSPSPALRTAPASSSRVAPLSPPVDGAHDVAEALRWQELAVDTRPRPIAGAWTWFRRRTRATHPATAVTVVPGIDQVTVRVRAENAAADHLAFELPLADGEHVTGFGERFNAVDQRGWRLECWTEEGAIGLGETLSRLLTRLGVSWNPLPKGPAVTYKPVPWLLSSRGYGILLRTSAPVFFDVGARDPGVLRCEAMTRELELVIVYGPRPRRLVQRLVELTDGKPRGLPDWALAPWLDALGGEERVRQVARAVREHAIPCSAIWIEDWQGLQRVPFGNTRWSYDAIFPVRRRPCRTLYPDLEHMIGELRGRGFRMLSYYYPYVPEDDEDYPLARARGYLVRDGAGKVAPIPMFMHRCGQIDLTSPEARQWYKDELRRGLALGFAGWMADFGEYTPIDSVTSDGRRGLEHHNEYPGLWARLNRELFDEERPDGDFVFFSRSGGPGQQRDTPVFWSGDSNTDFERWDGLPGNLRGLLSAGLSGFSVWTVDIGGYTCLFTRGRDRETLARWTELAAFLAVMRTHHGTHTRRCAQFDTDDATLAHFATYARLHTSLFPLRRALLDEAVETGLPIARALLLEHPADPACWAVEDQFLLGRDLLVAPVIERGANSRPVYLPAARDWIDLWTGARHAGGQRIEVAAPVGTIPLLLASDGLLPTFDTPVDTLLRRAQLGAHGTGVRTLDDAETSLSVFVGPDFEGEAVLHDGTRIAPGAARATTGPAHALWPSALTASWRQVGDARVLDAPGPRRVRTFVPVRGGRPA